MSSTSKTRVECGGIRPAKPVSAEAETKAVSTNHGVVIGSRIRTISHVGRDDEFPLFTLDHANEAFVPALDNLTSPERDIERLPATHRGIELCPSGEECSGLDKRRSAHRRWQHRSLQG